MQPINITKALHHDDASSQASYATGHFGELFQGQIRDKYGRFRRCLVTLPCNFLRSRARFVADDSGELWVVPRHKVKALATCALTLTHLGLPCSGRLEITSNITEGKGYGSSTADCVAAVLAVSRSMARCLSTEEISRLVVQAEIASDSVMCDRAVLFAYREGEILEDFGRSVPAFEVIGIDSDQQRTFDTVANGVVEYSMHEIEEFNRLVGQIRKAMNEGRKGLLASVATASAIINQRHRPKPLFPEIYRLAALSRALGVAVAHSGTIVGVLLDPDDDRVDSKAERIARELQRITGANPLRFRSGPQIEESAMVSAGGARQII
jgi:uncharacterized protein involved in propanediol utilization